MKEFAFGDPAGGLKPFEKGFRIPNFFNLLRSFVWKSCVSLKYFRLFELQTFVPCWNNHPKKRSDICQKCRTALSSLVGKLTALHGEALLKVFEESRETFFKKFLWLPEASYFPQPPPPGVSMRMISPFLSGE